ncbi:MAG: phosphoenolpyruvate--protein phosphotransferase [Deltaproteobacteria bacterium]|nr:phosphoenolpyruvate--protein phosphotransferase [Deltaproteobacteria bacterium]
MTTPEGALPGDSHKLILLEDISRIIVSSHDLAETLDHIAGLLADRMGVDVCSIYLFEDGLLVLRASRGLEPGALGRVSMTVGEGLTGLAFETAEPVNVADAPSHPRYKFFPGIGEEAFRSFVGVPLIYRRRAIGVLAVQTTRAARMPPDDVRLLVTAASQLSTVIAHARLLASGAESPAEQAGEEEPRPGFFRGIGASRGVARGAALVLAEEPGIEVFCEGAGGGVEAELAAFEEALGRSIADVVEIRDQVRKALSEEDGAIFHAHLMMLEDRGIQEKVRAQIRTGAAAARAVATVSRSYIETFRRLEDPYLRERAADVRDVGERLIRHIQEEKHPGAELAFSEPTVVIAEDITPSLFVRLMQPHLAGVALARGGENSHTAILCRSAGIPAVVGLGEKVPPVVAGEPAILDGNVGLLYLSPSERVTREYERLAEDTAKVEAEILTHLGEPLTTRDGARVRLLGNAALVADIPKIVQAGGEGVGLYRTEFPFLIRTSFPDEEEQLDIYAKILGALEGRPATLRTLDVGGDKSLPYLPVPKEENPHLGWRSIRVSLDMQEPFRIQLRALLRASLLGPLRIVFPMIATAGELREARGILEEEREGLRSRGVRLPEVPVGAMVEVPSAALGLERLAPHADFFSIGTNDLVQYLLAVDRANRKVAHLYDPLHPTVLETIGRIVETARRWQRPVAVCGEMAGRPLGAAALVALGVKELSLSPGVLPRVRRLIQLVDRRRLLGLATRLKAAEGAEDVKRLLRDELRDEGVPEPLWATE